MSALALEATPLLGAPTAGPQAAPTRRRPRAERSPAAKPLAAVGPVCAPERAQLTTVRGRRPGRAPVAETSWRLTERGLAVVTGSMALTVATAALTVVTQFLAIPA